MRDQDPADEAWKIERRSALKLTAGFIAAGTFVGNAVADGSDAGKKVTTCRVKQGDHEVEIEPLTGDKPVEELYDYRLPDKYEGVGTTSGEGQYYRSVGTKDLQRNATSTMFLYDGPNGLSFVVVHDAIDGDGGGSVSWEVASVPEGADWIVMDDYYTNSDTGERAASNYDNWNTGGTDHSIDWTWDSRRTDGGVLGYLGGNFSFTIHPAFNEKAALYGDYYDGDIENWEVLSGDLSSPDRISLDLDAAVTVSCTTKTKPKNGEGGKGKNGDGKNGDGEKSEEEKRRDEIEERQDEVEEEIEERRKELEEEIERKQEDIEKEIETQKTEMKSEAEKRHEEIAEKVEKGADRGESKRNTKAKTKKEVSARFETEVNWNSSDDE